MIYSSENLIQFTNKSERFLQNTRNIPPTYELTTLYTSMYSSYRGKMFLIALMLFKMNKEGTFSTGKVHLVQS